MLNALFVGAVVPFAKQRDGNAAHDVSMRHFLFAPQFCQVANLRDAAVKLCAQRANFRLTAQSERVLVLARIRALIWSAGAGASICHG
ncbi:MAG: hypothetical protein IPJ62_18200 [Betaproteobacteria bacterium]|nr:hypothetical protein [Betaproteobacteria bacterium]